MNYYQRIRNYQNQFYRLRRGSFILGGIAALVAAATGLEAIGLTDVVKGSNDFFTGMSITSLIFLTSSSFSYRRHNNKYNMATEELRRMDESAN